MNSKLHIDITIPFYNHNGDIHRTNLTRKIFKHYSIIRDNIKDKCNMTFTLVGSEGEISKKLALDYFNNEEYFEFDQTKYYDFWDMLWKKFNFCFSTSQNKNSAIIFLAGSNDYIPIDFFIQVINFYNPSLPQVYGIDNYNNGKNAVYFAKFDVYSNMLIDNNSIWWNGVSNYCNRDKYLYCGGIVGFNKKIFDINPNIISKFGFDEGLIEEELLKINGIQKFYSKEIFYFNIKTISNNDINKMDDFATVLPIQKLNFHYDFSNEFKQRINMELENFNRLGLEPRVIKPIIKPVKININTHKRIGLYGSGQLEICYSFFFNETVLQDNDIEIAFALGYYNYDKNYPYYKKELDYSIFDNINILIIENNKIYSDKIIEYCTAKHIKIIKLCMLQFPIFPINWSGYGENKADYINWSRLEDIDYNIRFNNCINILEKNIKQTNLDINIINFIKDNFNKHLLFIHSVHPTNILLYELYKSIFKNLNINIDNYKYKFTNELMELGWHNPFTTKMIADLNIIFNTNIDDNFYIKRYNENINSNKFDDSVYNTNITNKKKYAFIVMYELRAIRKTIDKLYKYIIDYYNADIFIVCQNQFGDDSERVKLFNRNVNVVKLYDKPNPVEYFGANSNINLSGGIGNWNNSGNMQIYINNNEVAKVIKDYDDDYDYFITLRTDSDILFDFIPPRLLEEIPPGVYGFAPNYCENWGGSGTANFIHKNYVLDYFSSYYNILTNKIYEKQIILKLSDNFNQEKLLHLALDIKNISILKIKHINIYYTGETLNDYSTWSKFSIHPYHNVICKYPEQCDEAYNSLTEWNKGKRWVYDNNTIYLK